MNNYCFFFCSGGEPGIGIPAVIQYPGYDSTQQVQKFPHRTFAMLVVMVSHVAVSCITRELYRRDWLSHFDFLNVFPEKSLEKKEGIILSEAGKGE